MNELIKLDAIKSISTADLRQALARSLEVTAQHLELLGKIWVELENRGEDLSALRSGMAIYLPMIGHGKLSAEAAVAFAGQQLLLRELALLPISEQEKLARGEKLLLVTVNRDKQATTQAVTASMLHSRHYSLVFDNGRIRSPEEQKSLLLAPTKRRRESVTRKKRVIVNKEQGLLMVSGMKIRIDDIVSALKEAQLI